MHRDIEPTSSTRLAMRSSCRSSSSNSREAIRTHCGYLALFAKQRDSTYVYRFKDALFRVSYNIAAVLSPTSRQKESAFTNQFGTQNKSNDIAMKDR